MPSISKKMIRRIRAKGRGWVFTPRDFIDFGSRSSVDVSLSRLKKVGAIRRIGHGLYDYPRHHEKLGMLSPTLEHIAQAVSKQSDEQVFVSGAHAANQLGISTQVPARVTYLTSGPSRTMQVAGRTIVFKHARVPLITNASDRVNAVIQTMAHLGRKNIDINTLEHFADRVSENDIKTLIRSRSQIPAWMGDAVLKIEAIKHG